MLFQQGPFLLTPLIYFFVVMVHRHISLITFVLVRVNDIPILAHVVQCSRKRMFSKDDVVDYSQSKKK